MHLGETADVVLRRHARSTNQRLTAVAQALAEGQTLTQVYTVTITDSHGAKVTQDVESRTNAAAAKALGVAPISEGVAASLRERLNKFDEAVMTYTRQGANP